MRLGPILRALGLAIVLAVTPGCLAPPIGLPPPEALEISCSGGLITIVGRASPGAYVSALNAHADSSLDIGVIVHADPTTGSFSLMIAGVPGDHIELWQEVGTVRSPFNDLTACGSGATADN